MPILKRFDPDTASPEYFKARHHYLNLRREEAMPEDPPRSLDYSITNAKSWKLFEKEKLEVWHLWEGDTIIAELFVSVGFHDDNRHLMWCELEVSAPYRQRGYTKGFLEKIVEIADQYERTLLMINTSSRIPAGALVAEHLGAKKGNEAHINQLVLSEVDTALLQTWIDRAKTTAHGFEMGFWGDTFPEEDIQAIANMIQVMNDAPRGNLEIEDWQTTPEQLRQGEAYSKARKIERWMLYARHESGELAGYTETFWDPGNPENLGQGGTGVLAKYRGHGLGKWLKAAMLQKVLAERKVVKRIRTGNADSNEQMLAINHALGFKPYIAEIGWQIEIEKIKEYL
ncbi:MAG: GNAT family N-acetyltransferase [Trueperaceae bacterium]